MDYIEDVEWLEPLTRLDSSLWRAKLLSNDIVALSVQARMNCRHWMKLHILDFPNELCSYADMERFGIMDAYRVAVQAAHEAAGKGPDDIMEASHPLVRLPYKEYQARIADDGRLELSIHERCGKRYWLVLDFLDFPNELASIGDLERLGVLNGYIAAVRKLKFVGTGTPFDSPT